MLRLAALIALITTTAAVAQDRRPSHCIAIADASPHLSYVHTANWSEPIEDEFTVRLTYIDHSMYLLQTAGGLSAVTDYTGFIGATPLIPTVVTMNNAHDSHWTAFPHPDIEHVLQGWRQAGEPAEHYVDLGELLVRNVTTDIRDRFGGGARIRDNNSIFVFEVAGLCIGHLGHLHHEPSEEHYAALGRLDVVMAAVDGGMTVDTATMIRIVKRLKSSVVLPMHWFARYSLDSFLNGVSDDFAIERRGTSDLELSLRTLPDRPTVIVLEPRYLRLDD